MTRWSLLVNWAALAGTAGIAAHALIALIIGWLRANAVAKVTARWSHSTETPESAGVVVVPVALLGATAALSIAGVMPQYGVWNGALIFALAVALTVMGFIDDARRLTGGARLAAQFICVVAVVATLPSSARVVPEYVPLMLERALIVIAGVWFVNLVNFMDGIDLISVTETCSVTLGIAILA